MTAIPRRLGVEADVARRLGLLRSWLSEQATAYLPRQPDDGAVAVLGSANLTVERASLPHQTRDERPD